MGVTGIGGIFIRAHDPAAMAAWYRAHLGIGTGEHGAWAQEAGPTIFAPFERDSDYFPLDRAWMLNVRVDDLGALIETLRAADIAVRTDPSWDDPATGRFARIHDPEGNPIELWQPPADAG